MFGPRVSAAVQCQDSAYSIPKHRGHLCLQYALLEKDSHGEPCALDINERDFIAAISTDNIAILQAMVAHTGSGISVDHFVKAAQLDAQDLPRPY
ncbi:hypothetical protein Cpir12675_005798 [Ceratocystis pirilliformis]|uniref:Uncharacterized protein n=1 Tax=Ceratocystis pirilliformis TaxID=259994 RepID=A0ABR3YMI5_9PEZI